MWRGSALGQVLVGRGGDAFGSEQRRASGLTDDDKSGIGIGKYEIHLGCHLLLTNNLS